MKTKNDDITFDEFKTVLQENSQRITLPRLGVLKILKSNHNPLTMSEIHDLINIENFKKKIDLATIYRTVNLFVELKIVSEVNFRDEFKRYELVFDRHHHHHRSFCQFLLWCRHLQLTTCDVKCALFSEK